MTSGNETDIEKAGEQVRAWLKTLQSKLCQEIAEEDGSRDFQVDEWQYPGGGGGISRVLEGGAVIEKGGVNFSHVLGDKLPPAASKNRQDLAGRPFEAMGVSVVMHPKNPFVPTSHMNVRFFSTRDNDQPVWWFGGGYDLTPYYPFHEDVVHWHQVARDACAPCGDGLYEKFKHWCDEYFYLKHRDETRGVGGLFFDDFTQGGFDNAFALMRSVGSSYVKAYRPIIARRKHCAFDDRHRDFQLYRRGRYVEFNLVYDRGTLFGLQSGGRTESILMSLPPDVRWRYDWHPAPGSDEATLYEDYLKPRDWLGES